MVESVDELVGEVEAALEEVEDDAFEHEVAGMEALAYVVGHGFEQDMAGLVSTTVEACDHGQGADLLGDLAVVDSLDPGFDWSQPPETEDKEVEAVH